MSHTIASTRQRTPMWVYEKNFSFLMVLLPELAKQSVDTRYLAEHKTGKINATVIEKNRYTQDLEIKGVDTIDSEHIRAICFKVRIYHDARVAEVISYQGHRRLRARYDYPNPHMHHPDEKRQTNYLLYDWLSLFDVDDFVLDNACICPDI